MIGFQVKSSLIKYFYSIVILRVHVNVNIDGSCVILLTVVFVSVECRCQLESLIFVYDILTLHASVIFNNVKLGQVLFKYLNIWSLIYSMHCH